jgi:hydrogenase nickel incorporation protein HypA/HybF
MLMHEASIAQSIIDTVRRWSAERENGAPVAAVFVRVGRMTSVVPDNLRFMFSVLTEDTALQGVRLEIEEVPVRSLCLSCGARREIERPCFICEECGSSDVDIESGRELVIDAVEVG